MQCQQRIKRTSVHNLRACSALAFANVKYAIVAEIWNAALPLTADAVIPTHIIDIYVACGICTAKLMKEATGVQIDELVHIHDNVKVSIWGWDLKAYGNYRKIIVVIY